MLAAMSELDASTADPMIGRVLDGRYRIVGHVGEGAMSVVYRAIGPNGEPVAIKVLQRELGEDPENRERFEREARALFGLSHPNILDVHDFGLVDGSPYLVMELLEGGTLDTVLEDGPPPVELAIELGRQMLRGLAYAHAQGALHRDLKTENICVAREANGSPILKLLDFGLVKFVDAERWGQGEKLTVQGAVFGTPAYMSPEQASGAPVDIRTDVYSAGVILFELLTGIWPFMEESRLEMFRAHLTTPPPSLRQARPELRFRTELETLVARALAKSPAERFPDAGAMLAALEAIPTPYAISALELDRKTKRPAWMWIAAAVTALGALAAILL